MRFVLLVSVFSFLCLSVGAAPQSAALGGLTVGDIINALKINLVQKINVLISSDSFTTNEVSVNVDVKNPLPIELTIDRIVNSASLNGTTYATFDHRFKAGFVIPIFGKNNSGNLPDVLLTRGVSGSLDIISYGVLDINSDVYIRAGTIFGALGIPITLGGLKQTNVPTTYTFGL